MVVIVFTVLAVAALVLTLVGTLFRGPGVVLGLALEAPVRGALIAR